MKKAVKMLMRGGLAVIFAAAMFAQAFAIEGVKPVTPAVSVPTRADLSIHGIYANSCAPCVSELGRVNAIYMNNITVGVDKKDISTPAAARTEPSTVVGTLRVTYYDFNLGRLETKSYMLQNSHFGASNSASITITTTPVLVKRSDGIRAEIQLNPGYAAIDPNAANNVMIKKDCAVLLE